MRLRIIVLMGAVVAMTACSKKSGGSNAPAPAPETPAPPAQALTVCTDQFSSAFSGLEAAIAEYKAIEKTEENREELKTVIAQLDSRCKLIFNMGQPPRCEGVAGDPTTIVDLEPYRATCTDALTATDGSSGGSTAPLPPITVPDVPPRTPRPPAPGETGPGSNQPGRTDPSKPPRDTKPPGQNHPNQQSPEQQEEELPPAPGKRPSKGDTGDDSYDPEQRSQQGERPRTQRPPADCNCTPRQRPPAQRREQHREQRREQGQHHEQGEVVVVTGESTLQQLAGRLAIRLTNVAQLRELSMSYRQSSTELVLLRGHLTNRADIGPMANQGSAMLAACSLDDPKRELRDYKDGDILAADTYLEQNNMMGVKQARNMSVRLGREMVLTCDRVGSAPLKPSDIQTAFGATLQLLVR